MGVKTEGLQLFRKSLYNAAARSLREKHPEFVDAFFRAIEETKDLSQAISMAKSISTDVGFAKWRPLLTATLDAELAINEIKTVLNLLRIVPSQNMSISKGEWVYYHWAGWTFWADALLERTKKLVKQVVRALIRPVNVKWKDIESDLLRSINLLSQDIGKVRDPLAHGGGAIEMPARERVWEGFILLAADVNRYDLPIDQVLSVMDKYHTTWYKRLNEKSVLMLNEIDKVIYNLNKHVDWDKI